MSKTHLLRFGAATLLAAVLVMPQGAAATGSEPNRADARQVEATASQARKALDAHLAAINARDLDALMATVTTGDALTLILPNGKVLTTREAYRQLHVDWFKDSKWRMVFDVQDVRVVGAAAIARVHYDAQERGRAGDYTSTRKAVLVLVFAQEHGGWRLVYDQNTVITADTPPAASAPGSD